jgi:uncharacterized integral membrane protein
LAKGAVVIVLYKIGLLALALIGVWILIQLVVLAYKVTRRVPGPFPIRFWLFALLLAFLLAPVVGLLSAVSR